MAKGKAMAGVCAVVVGDVDVNKGIRDSNKWC